MTKSYSPTEDEVLKALRHAQRDRDEAATTGWVQFCLGSAIGRKFDDPGVPGTQSIAQGSVRRQLEALKEKGLVHEVPNVGGYNVRHGEKTWVTDDRVVSLMAEREAKRLAQQARDEAQRAVQARLKALGIESYIAGPETLRVSVAGLQNLLDWGNLAGENR